MNERIVNNIPNPITGTRMNEMNEMFLEKLIQETVRGYFYDKRHKNDKRYEKAAECYKKARSACQLYSCLMEEDDERMRARVQAIADEQLNEIVSILTEINYIF